MIDVLCGGEALLFMFSKYPFVFRCMQSVLVRLVQKNVPESDRREYMRLLCPAAATSIRMCTDTFSHVHGRIVRRHCLSF